MHLHVLFSFKGLPRDKTTDFEENERARQATLKRWWDKRE
jgi:hypothetical protein